jgi:putative protein-disulfide isomerase
MNANLYYIHDPMCSWCWAFRPTWDLLRAKLPQSVTVVNIVGGLAPDTAQPMPEALQQTIKAHWYTIHNELGTTFNFDFWEKNTPRRSTYLACRAAIAAHNQQFEEPMIDAIQRAYYLCAMNPSDQEVIIYLAQQCAQDQCAQDNTHIDVQQFYEDLNSTATEQELERQIAFAQALPSQGFPSLVLDISDKDSSGKDISGNRTVIKRDYKNHQNALLQIESLISI